MAISRCGAVRALARAVVCYAALSSASAHAASVVTWHNDNARTGLNATETILTPQAVASGRFGRRFAHPVDGQVYAQPLYVPSISVPGKGVHNVVYVATEHDSVYAFDADSDAGLGADPLWHVNFLGPGATTVSSDDIGCGDLAPEVGITGTPVIDPVSRTLYVVARTVEPDGSGGTRHVQRLHALDIATGAEKRGSPVEIAAAVPGTGDGGTEVVFNPAIEHQRAALVLSRGIVYVAWASHCDHNDATTGKPYHGWIIGYNAATLARTATWVASPDAAASGIWQGNAGPAVDALGNLFVITGNGRFDAKDPGGRDYGDSVIRLKTAGGLGVADYFTPTNEADLDQGDVDFGAGGPMLLPDQPGPHPHLVLACGKDGNVYVVDRDAMGHFDATAPRVVQVLPAAVQGAWSSPAYWNGRVYYLGSGWIGQGDRLKAFALAGGKLSTSPVSQT